MCSSDLELLDQAAEMVLAMVKQLRHGINARNAREMNAKLQGIEGDADKLELERLRDLFKGVFDGSGTRITAYTKLIIEGFYLSHST